MSPPIPSLHDLPPCPTVDTLVVSSWPPTSHIYDDVINLRLQGFVELRERAGFPLKAFTLVTLPGSGTTSIGIRADAGLCWMGRSRERL